MSIISKAFTPRYRIKIRVFEVLQKDKGKEQLEKVHGSFWVNMINNSMLNYD